LATSCQKNAVILAIRISRYLGTLAIFRRALRPKTLGKLATGGH
jgi:hypothetical protein